MAFAETSPFMIIGQDGHKYNDLFNLSGKTQAVGIPAIMNSDQGSQFTSGEYKQLMKDPGIRQSMDGKSRWADNIMIERWFRSLKTELIYCNEF